MRLMTFTLYFRCPGIILECAHNGRTRFSGGTREILTDSVPVPLKCVASWCGSPRLRNGLWFQQQLEGWGWARSEQPRDTIRVPYVTSLFQASALSNDCGSWIAAFPQVSQPDTVLTSTRSLPWVMCASPTHKYFSFTTWVKTPLLKLEYCGCLNPFGKLPGPILTTRATAGRAESWTWCASARSAQRRSSPRGWCVSRCQHSVTV